MTYTVTGKSMFLWFQQYVWDIDWGMTQRRGGLIVATQCVNCMLTEKLECSTDRICWETRRASVVLCYSRLGVFTICSSAPVVTLCLLVTSASSSMLFQCRRPSEMSGKCWGRRLTNWWGRTMPITTPSAHFLLKGKCCMFYLSACRQLRRCLHKSRCNSVVERCSWCFIQSLYFRQDFESQFFSLTVSSSFLPTQGEYMSQQLLWSWRVSCGELHWFGVLWVWSQLEGGSLWRPLLPGRLWLPWKRSLPGQGLRLQERMARWVGTAAVSLRLPVMWPHYLMRCAGLNNHNVIGSASAGPHMPNPSSATWISFSLGLCPVYRMNSGSGPRSW